MRSRFNPSISSPPCSVLVLSIQYCYKYTFLSWKAIQTVGSINIQTKLIFLAKHLRTLCKFNIKTSTGTNAAHVQSTKGHENIFWKVIKVSFTNIMAQLLPQCIQTVIGSFWPPGPSYVNTHTLTRTHIHSLSLSLSLTQTQTHTHTQFNLYCSS